MNIDSALKAHWEGLLKPLFPDGSEFKVHEASPDFKATISWKLGTDRSRPNKRSKVIVVVVSAEAVDDYRNKPAGRQHSDDEKLKRFIQAQLAKHDPNHNNAQDVPPPEVQWVAGSNILDS